MMHPALEALPARPLSAEDVATLNDAPAFGIIPYSWYGDQVIAMLLLYDERRAGENREGDQETGETPTDDDADQDGGFDRVSGDSDQRDSSEQQPTEEHSAETAEAGDSPAAESEPAHEEAEGQPEQQDDPEERAPGEDSRAGEPGPNSTSTEADHSKATSRTGSTTPGFGSDDSAGVGTVEVIDSGDLRPGPNEDSLGPNLGGETDEQEAADTDPETADSDPAEMDEADALHVYAVGFDGETDSWVAIAEIDPDAELTDAEPLFREWATRTYHDQIVERLAVGPSEYDIED